jgi:hypothetical protein
LSAGSVAGISFWVLFMRYPDCMNKTASWLVPGQ